MCRVFSWCLIPDWHKTCINYVVHELLIRSGEQTRNMARALARHFVEEVAGCVRQMREKEKEKLIRLLDV